MLAIRGSIAWAIQNACKSNPIPPSLLATTTTTTSFIKQTQLQQRCNNTIVGLRAFSTPSINNNNHNHNDNKQQSTLSSGNANSESLMSNVLFSKVAKTREAKDVQPEIDNYSHEKLELARDFIQDALYNSEYGYFNNPELIISPGVEQYHSIDFATLKDQHEYVEAVRSLYLKGAYSWATPVELFRPWYAMAIADYILEQWRLMTNNRRDDANNNNNNKPLVIYEFGGGNGTCALGILDYLRDEHPEVYQHTQYHIIEISHKLHEIQKQRNAHHEGHFHTHRISITEWNTRVEEDCFVIALEVLDNLPHDKVVQSEGALHQVHVMNVGKTEEGLDTFKEVYMPLHDPTILRYLRYSDMLRPYGYTFESSYRDGDNGANSGDGGGGGAGEGNNDNDNVISTSIQDLRPKTPWVITWYRNMVRSFRQGLLNSIGGEEVHFVPTVSLMMMEVLARYFPRHRFICADFDFLPGAIEGANGPCVQRKFRTRVAEHNGEKYYFSRSFKSYLMPKGTCDIFFPTNFEHMQRVYSRVCGGRGSVVMKNHEFMQRYARLDKMTTKDGYNPMLRDYRNMSVFLS